jgi:hypothetical protein
VLPINTTKQNEITGRLDLKNGGGIDLNSAIICKIQKLNRLQELQRGHVYMKTLDYFREKERRYPASGAGDSEEGIIARMPTADLYVDMGSGKFEDSKKVAELENVAMSVIGKTVVFCATCLNFEQKDDRNPYILTYSPNEKMLVDFASGPKEKYGILFILRDPFIARCKSGLIKRNLGGRAKRIIYVDNPDPKQFSKDPSDAAFVKRTKFSHQNEYRLWVNTYVEDHLILDIGDISDISVCLPMDMGIELIAEFKESENDLVDVKVQIPN